MQIFKGFILEKRQVEVFQAEPGQQVNKAKLEHCVKSVRIWSFSGPYSVPWENTDQKNSKYGHFLCSGDSDNRTNLRKICENEINCLTV